MFASEEWWRVEACRGAQERGMRVRAIRRVVFCEDRYWSKRAGSVVWDDGLVKRLERS